MVLVICEGIIIEAIVDLFYIWLIVLEING